MAFDYHRDEALHSVLLTYRGGYALSEVLSMFDRVSADDAWSYALTYDLRAMHGAPTMEDLEQIVAARNVIVSQLTGTRGSVLFLVADHALYARVCAYAARMTAVPMDVFAFMDVDEPPAAS